MEKSLILLAKAARRIKEIHEEEDGAIWDIIAQTYSELVFKGGGNSGQEFVTTLRNRLDKIGAEIHKIKDPTEEQATELLNRRREMRNRD